MPTHVCRESVFRLRCTHDRSPHSSTGSNAAQKQERSNAAILELNYDYEKRTRRRAVVPPRPSFHSATFKVAGACSRRSRTEEIVAKGETRSVKEYERIDKNKPMDQATVRYLLYACTVVSRLIAADR
ncbi:uncharacterized protein LOC143151519 [Ptiloglossa arizonensis]|uniref:uncharacterized protein LOC143151519 n=1 Tax=Ptiloglossa arizonensis TaxID=3350558 RepID=UPI003FA056D4